MPLASTLSLTRLTSSADWISRSAAFITISSVAWSTSIWVSTDPVKRRLAASGRIRIP
jgi:hypothetical protein